MSGVTFSDEDLTDEMSAAPGTWHLPDNPTVYAHRPRAFKTLPLWKVLLMGFVAVLGWGIVLGVCWGVYHLFNFVESLTV